MNAREMLLAEFHRLAEVPDAVPRLRRFVLDLAVRGKLVEQDADDKSASRALSTARRYLEDLAGRTGRLRWRASEPIQSSEAVGDLPRGWTHARVNDTGLYINGLAFKPSDWGTEGLPIIRIQNLTDPAKPMSRAKGEFPDEVLVRPGDLLVSWSATLEAFRWDREVGVLNQHIFRVLPATEFVTPGFLLLLLRHAIRVMAEGIHAHGLVMTHINRGPFLAHVVAVPPLAEQRRIVAKVDELMALCDRLEEAQGELATGRDGFADVALAGMGASESPHGAALCLKHFSRVTANEAHISRLREAIRDLAVRGLLLPQDPSDPPASELVERIREAKARLAGKRPERKERDSSGNDGADRSPSGWTSAEVGDLCDMITSGSRGWAEYYAETGPGFIRAQNIRFGRLRLDDLAHVNPPNRAEGSRTRVAQGDVLLVITGAGVTNPALLDVDLEEAYVSQHVALVRPVETSVSRWLLLCLMAPAGGRAALVERAYGAGKPGLNLDNIRSLRIPIPPLSEQARIVASVEQLMVLCDELVAQLKSKQTEGIRLIQGVLQEALSETS